MFKSVYSRCYGQRKINNLNSWSSVDVSNVLECFEGRAREEYILASEEDGGTVPPLACSFCKVKSIAGNVLALVDENGYLVLHNTTKSGPDAILKEWQAHSNAVFDLAWMEEEEKLVTASGDQTAVLWDAKTSQKLETFKGHTSSIRSVAFRKQDDSVLATGSRDGHIMLWDKRCNHKDGSIPAINTIKNAHVISTLKQKKRNRLGPALDSQQSVTVVTFQSDNKLISAGAVDGFVKVWDLRKNYTMSNEPISSFVFPYAGSCQRKHGYSCLTLDSNNSTMYASCTDDVIYVYDLISYHESPVKTIRGHKNTTFYIKTSLSPNDKFLLSGSSDDMAYIWQVEKPSTSPVILKGHNAEVTSVAWCKQDMTKVATVSDDNTMRIWRVNRGTDNKPTPGEVSGVAELTHREIGTSTVAVRPSLSVVQPRINLSASPAPKKLMKKQVSEPTPSKSPSLKAWLSGQIMCSPSESPKSTNDKSQGNQLKTKSDAKRTSLNFSNSMPINSKNLKESNCDERNTEKSVCVPLPFQDSGSNIENVTPSDNKCDLNDGILPPLLTTPQKTSLKRKLDQEDSEACEPPSKRSNILQDSGVVNTEVTCKPACVESCQKNEMTPKFSPTQNLPNLVLDELEGRSPRTVRGDKENCQSRKKLDWLTQIRLNREGFEGTCLLSPGKSQTSSDEFSGISSDNASPIRAKTPLKGRNSIIHYFQKNRK